MTVNVRIPGLAWDDMMGGSYGQDAAGPRPEEECEEPGIVRAIRAAKFVPAGRGFYAAIHLTTAADADGLLVLAEALVIGAVENGEYPQAVALRKAAARLADAKATLTREEDR